MNAGEPPANSYMDGLVMLPKILFRRWQDGRTGACNARPRSSVVG
jgi:hypothetical protein